MNGIKIIAIVVCYHPSHELLINSLASYASYVDKILVWRNSLLPNGLESELASRFEVEFRGDCTNVGIPTALNTAWKEAVAGNYDCLLTMDQDSIWHNFDAFLSQALDHGLCKCFYAPIVTMMGETVHPGVEPSLTPIDNALTSGMLIPISVLNEVEGWDKRFKIDAVDLEFCLHARSLGIQCWRCSSGWLAHRLGDRRPASFLGLHFYTYNYSPERLYGIYRNHIIVLRRYRGKASKEASQSFVHNWVRRRPIRILLGEENRWAKFHAIIRGIRDGLLS